MGGNSVAIGPFNGGLNLSQAPRLIADSELSRCINFDIGDAGNVYLRAGVRSFTGATFNTGTQQILGVSKLTNTANELYVTGQRGTNDYEVRYTNNILNPTWVSAFVYPVGVQAGDATQYNNKLWIPANGASTPPSPQGRSIDVTTHAVTTITAMPQGTKSFMYKERLFLFKEGEYRVYYSASLFPDQWPAANFFDINPGDGEPILSAVVSGESIIFFKQNSTYTLYFDTDPGLGTLRKLNTDIGVTGKFSVCLLNNDVYTMGHRGVYRLTNGFFESISDKLDIPKLRSSFNVDYISPLGDRLLIRINTANGYRYFVYKLSNNTWTEYEFPAGKIFNTPYRFINSSSQDNYVFHSDENTLYAFIPLGTGTQTEAPVARLKTKDYDFGDYSGFKRLYWFSVEALSSAGFVVSLNADRAVAVSTGHAAPAVQAFGTFKNFLSRRFRVLSMSVDAGGVLNSKFEMIGGTLNIDLKRRVSQRETV